MDKDSFGKIRNAVRSISAQRADAEKIDFPKKEHVHKAIDYIKLLQGRDESGARNYVEAHSDLWQERQKMGEEHWKIFNDVSKEKWGIEMQALGPKLDQIVESTRDRDDASMRFRDAIYLAISKTTDATMGDPRIQEAFPGKKKKNLERVVRSYNARTKVAQEDEIRRVEKLWGIRSEDDEDE